MKTHSCWNLFSRSALSAFLVLAAFGPALAAQEDDPRQLDLEVFPLTTSFPEGLGAIRAEEVTLNQDGKKALSFRRYVAHQDDEFSAELALIPLSDAVDLQINPRHRLGAMAELMSRKAGGGRSESPSWFRGFPAHEIRFNGPTDEPARFHRIRLVHFPEGIAFQQTISRNARRLHAPDVGEFFDRLNHKKARPPRDYVHRGAALEFRYLPETRFDSLDGTLRLRTPDGATGLSISRAPSPAGVSAVESLAEILAGAVRRHGPLELIHGPAEEAPEPSGLRRFRLEFLEPGPKNGRIHRVFIYLEENKTRTLLAGFCPEKRVEPPPKRPYYPLASEILHPLSTFQLLRPKNKKDE